MKIIFHSEVTLCDPLELTDDSPFSVVTEGPNSAGMSSKSHDSLSNGQKVCGGLQERGGSEERGDGRSQQSMSGEEEVGGVEEEAKEEKKEMGEQEKGGKGEEEEEEGEEEKKKEEEEEDGAKDMQGGRGEGGAEEGVCRPRQPQAHDDVTTNICDYVQSLPVMSPSKSPTSSNWNYPEYLHSPPTSDYVLATATSAQPYNTAYCSDTIGTFQQSNPLPEISQVTLSDSTVQHVCDLQLSQDSSDYTAPFLPTTPLSPPSPLPPLPILLMPSPICEAGPPMATLEQSPSATARELAGTEQHLTEGMCPSPVPSDSQDEIISSVLDNWTVQDSSSTWCGGPGGTSGTSLTSTETCSNDYYRIAMHMEH